MSPKARQDRRQETAHHRWGNSIGVLAAGWCPTALCSWVVIRYWQKYAVLQMARGLHREHKDAPHVSGEDRRQIADARTAWCRGGRSYFCGTETQLEQVFATIKNFKPTFIMDSLQTFSTGTLESAPGSVSQVREGRCVSCTRQIRGIAVWLVGHVTKRGASPDPSGRAHVRYGALILRRSGRLLSAASDGQKYDWQHP